MHICANGSRQRRGTGMSYIDRLRAREDDLGRPVRVGLVGAGQMGLGFVAQATRIPGMEVAAIAEVRPERAARAFQRAGRTQTESGGTVAEASAAITAGRPVVVADALALPRLPID